MLTHLFGLSQSCPRAQEGWLLWLPLRLPPGETHGRKWPLSWQDSLMAWHEGDMAA